MAAQDDAALQELYTTRWADAEPRTALQQLVPDDALRALASRRMAETILQAHTADPGRWGFSDRVDLLRLNVGPAEAVFIVGEGLRLMVHLPTAIRGGHKRLLETLEPTLPGLYRSVPESVCVTISFAHGAHDFAALLDKLGAGHEAHVAIAIGKGLNGMTRKGHHPGLVDAVAAESGITLPQPSYVRVSAPAALTSAAEPGIPPQTEKATEGGRYETTLSRVERDSRLRVACLEHHGTRCACCSMDLGEAYGKAGAGLIHVHHLRPASDGERETDPIRDLRPVCPNCHMVIHAGGNLRTVEQVGALYRASRGGIPA